MTLDVRSPEWHAERRKGIGASDVPAIAGISPSAKPIDVWLQKVGLAEPSEDTPLMRWGRLLEPVIADEFAAQTGRKVRRLGRAVRYRDWPILFAHLDRRVDGGGILECKSSMTTHGWGESGSADVPDHVALQVQAQLAAANQEVAHVAALIGYRDFRVYEILRDRELFEDAILPLLREFWRLVETETPPDPDGSEAYDGFLRRRNAADDGSVRVATPEEQLVAAALADVTRQKARLEESEKRLKQRLMDAMGPLSVLEGPGWRVTWKKAKDSERVKWELVAQAYRRLVEEVAADRASDLDAIQSLYTETKAGNRPFLFKPAEAIEEAA